MTASQQMLLGGASGNANPGMGPFIGSANGPTGNAGTVLLQFNTDGSLTKTINGVGFSGSIGGSSNWAYNVIAGIGTGVWVRVSNLSVATAFLGPTAFTQLTSNQSFGYSAQTADRLTTCQFDFSYDGVSVAFSVTGCSFAVGHT